AAFTSWARSFIAARSSSVNPLDFFLADFCVPLVAGFLKAIAKHLPVLKWPEGVAIGVGDVGHQAAAADVACGLLDGGTRGGYLGQLRLDVGHRCGSGLQALDRGLMLKKA